MSDLRSLIALLEARVLGPIKHPKTKSVKSLPKVGEETWDDGTHITWRASPFPHRSKPQLPSRLHNDAEVRKVPLASLNSSQTRVTEHGVLKHLKVAASDKASDLPLVYREHDGSHTIGDGHHRLVAAHLRGATFAQARVVDVPK
jgi:hypothetical protein